MVSSISVYDSVSGEHRISHSELAQFRRCRRRWYWHFRELLTPVDSPINPNLWFGSGFHYALEDYHGFRKFPQPIDAFEHYANQFTPEQLPDSIDELMDLATGMLNYYTKYWLPRRPEFATVWINDKPMVEIPFEIKMGDCLHNCPSHSGRIVPIYLVGTLDRLVKDTWGRLWIQDYKTAIRFDTFKLPTDFQVSVYTYAGDFLFGKEIEGVLYTQFKKAVPDYPRRLQNGSFSKDKTQKTTYALYTEALEAEYGRIPDTYNEILNFLAETEQPEGDYFIRQDVIRRNVANRQSTRAHIDAEVAELLDPNTVLYPNPTEQCIQCQFREPCIELDSDGNWQDVLEIGFEKRTKQRETTWQINLPQMGEELELVQ